MSMPRKPAGYPIRVVARMTGLSLDTLRAWERRYQVVMPSRGDRGRLYDDGDVERLKLLARLVDEGHAIGSLAGLPPAALSRLGSDARTALPKTAVPAVDLAPLVQAMKHYDVAAVDTTLNRHAALLPVDALIFSVVLPVLREAGARWEAGTIRPAQEHLVSATIRSVLGGLLRTMARPRSDEPMVFATPAGERHELGLLAAAVLAAHAGHLVTYLGPDVPGADMVDATVSVKAARLVLCATMSNVTTVRELRALRRVRPEVAIWVGGADRARVRRELGARARTIDTLEQFAALVDRPRS
jgi:MerR family transcriptional regulator, light-induced transcriptional regulator